MVLPRIPQQGFHFLSTDQRFRKFSGCLNPRTRTLKSLKSTAWAEPKRWAWLIGEIFSVITCWPQWLLRAVRIMATESLSASGHSRHVSISSENSEWWLTIGFFPVKHHTACFWAFWTYTCATYTHSVCSFFPTDDKWGGAGVYIVQVIYRESKMEPNAAAGN